MANPAAHGTTYPVKTLDIRQGDVMTDSEYTKPKPIARFTRFLRRRPVVSGVGAIVSLFKRARTLGGDVKISGLRGQPREIFKLLRLDRAFDIFEDVQAAAEAF